MVLVRNCILVYFMFGGEITSKGGEMTSPGGKVVGGEVTCGGEMVGGEMTGYH